MQSDGYGNQSHRGWTPGGRGEAAPDGAGIGPCIENRADACRSCIERTMMTMTDCPGSRKLHAAGRGGAMRSSIRLTESSAISGRWICGAMIGSSISGAQLAAHQKP